MSMPLHARINRKELAETPRFSCDFLAGKEIRDLVLRMDEVHPSEDNKTRYLFLIWVKPGDHARAERLIRQNLKNFGDQDRMTRILPDTGEGLIILSTWI